MLRAVASVTLWVAVASAAWFVWPTSLGGCTTLTIVSGHSMEPTYYTGDLVVTRCGQPKVGDIVVYTPPELGGRIIHRLISGDGQTGWQVKGDNNSWVDPFIPTNHDVLGIARLHVPKIGLFAKLVTTPYVWASLIVLALALLAWPRDDDEDGERTADDDDATGDVDVAPASVIDDLASAAAADDRTPMSTAIGGTP